MKLKSNIPVIKIKENRRTYTTIVINGKPLKMRGDRLV